MSTSTSNKMNFPGFEVTIWENRAEGKVHNNKTFQSYLYSFLQLHDLLLCGLPYRKQHYTSQPVYFF